MQTLVHGTGGGSVKDELSLTFAAQEVKLSVQEVHAEYMMEILGRSTKEPVAVIISGDATTTYEKGRVV